MIDSFGIGEGMCTLGNRHPCTHVHSPANVICFAADPDVLCARLAREIHLGQVEEREKERQMLMDGLEAVRDCDKAGESRGAEK